MTVLTRFAPSPTGWLHVGNARTALITWLYAKKHGGNFMFRLDDTDAERSKQEYVDGLHRDLEWLGLEWDQFAKQSDRWDRYNEAIQKLKDDGRLYRCYESPEELALKRKALLNAGKPPVYDRSGLKLSDEDRAKLEAEGRRPHWRFKLVPGEITWEDMARGSVSFQAEDMSDPVMIREDGRPLYSICSVVDDMDFGVTHVIRGEDHVSNTATHVQMIEALGGTVPTYAHLALLAGAKGEKLSKRLDSLGVNGMREEGLEALSVLSILARIGTPDAVVPATSIDQLVEGFDISRFGRATPKFDPEDLKLVNARILRQYDFDDVADRLAAHGCSGDNAADIWSVVRENVDKLEDAKQWWDLIDGPVTPVIEDAEFCAKAAELLPDGEWDEGTWKAWTDAVKEATGAKGKTLFMPLRLALTGLPRGPEIGKLLPLLGRDKVLQRLQG